MDHLDEDQGAAPGLRVPAARAAVEAMPGSGRWRGRPTTAGAVDVVAGLVTALFSAPQGMAYAAMVGFDAEAGLYAGVWPSIVGSLLVRTPLMVTTLTSAIALTARGALRHAHLDPAVPGNVAALTLMVALAMVLFTVLRLGSLLRLVPGGAMAGFSVGCAVQIIAGAMHEATGFRTHHHNRLLRVLAWLAQPGQWSTAATAVAVLTVLVWALAHAVPRVRPLAVLIALVVTAVLVRSSGVAVPLAGSLGRIPDGVPPLTMPAWGAMPHLVGGACSVALVALAQAAGISPGPAAGQKLRPADRTRDMLVQAAANVVGAFCHALPVGGSPSRTAVSVGSGARTRWAGVVSGCVLALLLWSGLGEEAGLVPLPVVGALLIVIGVRLAVGRVAALRAAWCGGPGERAVLVATFLAVTQLPLPDVLLVGLLLCLARLAVDRCRLVAADTDDRARSSAVEYSDPLS
ncbi:SulP family inorganic anion transporter [Kitasatospora sp. RB6PN24]|uniref:SulP family inorganic anion transporter n=1 Tax=Kitasatospora humi TaxID=2893891 RepID=UPI001E514638|nr:SulP family inorganic anion transporter [Kitasatospora humi]MCC9311410.1 SulP family inorganic anion transporter [Kitasatospora humi]